MKLGINGKYFKLSEWMSRKEFFISIAILYYFSRAVQVYGLPMLVEKMPNLTTSLVIFSLIFLLFISVITLLFYIKRVKNSWYSSWLASIKAALIMISLLSVVPYTYFGIQFD